MKDWLRNGWLVKHETSSQEIEELLRIADRDLRECQTVGLSPDWRLAMAYNSGLGSATAALSAAGYRATRDGHHFRIIQSLAYAIGAGAELIARLAAFRKKRNMSDYERSGAVSAQEADEMFVLAKMLRKSVGEWLEKSHPKLLRG